MIEIICALFFCGFYDWLVWFHGAKEQPVKWEMIYRVIKETVDLVVVPFMLYYFFNCSLFLIGIFYFLKWFGWSDGVYILLSKLWRLGKTYVDGDMWWVWWTPLGMSRSQFVYSLDLSTFEPYEYFHVSGHWYFLKGKLTFTEFVIQLLIGASLNILFYTICLM